MSDAIPMIPFRGVILAQADDKETIIYAEIGKFKIFLKRRQLELYRYESRGRSTWDDSNQSTATNGHLQHRRIERASDSQMSQKQS